MLTIERVDLSNKAQVKRFIDLQFRLYRNSPQWVPPLLMDQYIMLNPQKHPFYEHSQAEFYLAVRDGRDVARLGVMHNHHFNEYHKRKQAHFTLFECEDDAEAVAALFDRAMEWAKQQGLDELVGPRGLSSFDGYGVLVEGFEYRQMMTMYSYNYPYYGKLMDAMGFAMELDFTSFLLETEDFHMPEAIQQIAQKVMERNKFTAYRFKNKADLKQWAWRIGQAYNGAFVNNWEYYPLTEREVKFLLDNLLTIADPKLIKIIRYHDEVAGFTLAFPDVSGALQRAKGKLTPISIADILLETRRTDWVCANGGGVLPQFQGRGLNALLYAEMNHLATDGRFKHIDIPQNASSAAQMRKDILRLGAKPYRVHRVYRKGV